MKQSPHKAFTLIESMIAVTILTLSIIGPLIAAQRAIVAAETARDQLTASYLAQEGIEYVRAARDNQFLAAYPSNTANAWNNFLNPTYSAVAACISSACILGPLQQSGGSLCLGPTCTSPFTLQTGGTPFTRTIQLTTVSATDERVTSTVSWSFHSLQYAVTITDHLTPWQ